MSSTYYVRPTKLGKALGGLLISLGILIALIGWWAILFQIGFSISYIMGDYPLVERMMYLFVRLGLIFAPPYFIFMGLLGMGKGPWILKEIVLEPDRIVFRKKNGKEFALHDIKEMKKLLLSVNIRGRSADGKLVTRGTWPCLPEKFVMFKSDLERLYGVKV